MTLILLPEPRWGSSPYLSSQGRPGRIALHLVVAQGQLCDVTCGQIVNVKAAESTQLCMLWNGVRVVREEGQMESWGLLLLIASFRMEWNKESEKPALKPGLWGMKEGGEWRLYVEEFVNSVYNF